MLQLRVTDHLPGSFQHPLSHVGSLAATTVLHVNQESGGCRSEVGPFVKKLTSYWLKRVHSLWISTASKFKVEIDTLVDSEKLEQLFGSATAVWTQSVDGVSLAILTMKG